MFDCRQFNKISISFWYKRKDTGSATEGLITNGNSNTSPSILISSDKNSLSVVLKTETNTLRKSGIPVRGMIVSKHKKLVNISC